MYDWQADAIGSWRFALRMMALRRGAARFETLWEMYWLESQGSLP